MKADTYHFQNYLTPCVKNGTFGSRMASNQAMFHKSAQDSEVATEISFQISLLSRKMQTIYRRWIYKRLFWNSISKDLSRNSKKIWQNPVKPCDRTKRNWCNVSKYNGPINNIFGNLCLLSPGYWWISWYQIHGPVVNICTCKNAGVSNNWGVNMNDFIVGPN